MRFTVLLALVLTACDASDTADCEAPRFPAACCCQGDVVQNPTCSGDQLICKTGYTLYRGDDCQCIAGRNSPCCTPPPPDTGSGG